MSGDLPSHPGIIMEPAATHQLVLAACAAYTTGPILELGAGYGSTPLLHGWCAPRHRALWTIEAAADWAARFVSLRTAWHRIECCQYAACRIEESSWDLAFVDHAPAERRIVDIARLRTNTRLLVVHDTEAPEYRYEQVFPLFRFRVDHRLWPTWTTVLSDTDDLSWLEALPAMCRPDVP